MANKPTDGKFSLSYFLNGEGSKDWLRSYGDFIRIVITIVVIGAIIFTIYTMFFKKPSQNINKPDTTPTVVALPGSHIGTISQTTHQSNEQKIEEKKRPWWLPIPYVAAYGEARSKSGDSFSLEPGYGFQAGVRLDFN